MSTSDGPLASMRDRLRELLGLLEQADGDASALKRAMAECAANFESLRALPDPDEAELEQTLRLNTVVLSRVRTEVESLARGIRQARGVRGHVGARESVQTTGSSCDIAG